MTCTLPQRVSSRGLKTGKAWAMMHQMKFEDPDGFRRTPVSAPLPRRGTDAGRRRGQSAVSSLYSAVRPGRSQSRPRQSRAPGLNCGDAISPALAAYAPRARSSSPSSTSRSPLRPWRCSGCPGGSSSRCQPVWLTGGEFVDQRAQLAPGHANKVRVDRLQGRRPLVTQRARNQ